MIKTITTISDLKETQVLWQKDIDPYSNVFHSYEWVKATASVSTGWTIFLDIVDGHIQGMIPVDKDNTYLGALYTDYTDPFSHTSTDWCKNVPDIVLPRSCNFKATSTSSKSCYAIGMPKIPKKIISDLTRQRKKIKHYAIETDATNTKNLFAIFYADWHKKWQWPLAEAQKFAEFVSLNKALSSSLLYINKEPAALWLYTVWQKRLIFWVTSRKPIDSFSTGIFLLSEIVKLHPQMAIYDIGIGLESYKTKLFPNQLPLYNVTV